MTASSQTYPEVVPAGGAILPAAFEVLVYLALVAGGALGFQLGWLGINGAVILCTLLLVGVTALAWYRFDEGRHPCFLFLCTLMFFQGGRLLAYCLGEESDPMRVTVMTPTPFDLSRDQIGIVLLSLALSAICIYIPCRWSYRHISPPSDAAVKRYLPYLYLVLAIALPLQMFKNYRYYQYAQEHGGYTFLWVDHAALASSVPFFVRAAQLITVPVFLAIFVFERRKKLVILATILYFATASIMLLLGSRATTFMLVLVLWYIAKIKSPKRSRILRLAVAVVVLLAAGFAIQQVREESTEQIATFTPLKVLDIQGASLSVTEVAIKERALFRPYVGSYLKQELLNGFVANDAATYYRGRDLGFDISVLLNPALFATGTGVARSYVAEEYVIAGLTGVVLISLLIGAGLHCLHRFSRKLTTLLIVALLLPYVLVMPRNGLLDWASALAQIMLAILVLWVGWLAYSFVFPFKPARIPAPLAPATGASS